jgi:hypothetical protein
MPNVTIKVKVSGKWKPDRPKAKRLLLRGAAWTGLGAGSVWLIAGGQVVPPPDAGTPANMPICRHAPTAGSNWCSDLRSGSHN